LVCVPWRREKFLASIRNQALMPWSTSPKYSHSANSDLLIWYITMMSGFQQ